MRTQRKTLAVKTEAKKGNLLSWPFLCLWSLGQLSNRPVFSLTFLMLPIYSQKPILLSCTSLISQALSFLAYLLSFGVMPLHSPQNACPCFHLLCTSFLHLRSLRGFLFIHVAFCYVFLTACMSWTILVL